MGQYWRLINIDKRQWLPSMLEKIQEIMMNSSHASLIPYLVVPTTPVDPSVYGAEYLGSWAGDRLMLIGDYNGEGGYPKLTTEEAEVFDEVNLYHAAEEWETVPHISLPDDPVAFAHDKVWVLRNLTQRYYVRSDAFGTAAEDMVGPEAMRGRTLADVLLSEIHWSCESDHGSANGQVIGLIFASVTKWSMRKGGRIRAIRWQMHSPQPSEAKEKSTSERTFLGSRKMGQHWQLINLDKRQTFGQWGDLKSIFLNGLSPEVVPYLTIPTTPLHPSFPHAERIGSWAGDRIVCLGEHTSADDHPRDMLTESELVATKECCESLYHTAMKSYEKVPAIGALPDNPAAFAYKKPWVLRNLSKRQFVRANFGTPCRDVFGPEVGRPCHSLGDVLMSRVTWSSDDDDGFKRRVAYFMCGDWAGDRFDIQTVDRVQDGGWEDVSLELEDVVRRIENEGNPRERWYYWLAAL
ncbi:hypothetical protein H0H81_008020 [Sphagnurus paluster]|uniref:Uncharacterized protein n=1 Tax=Sphagnurus paluster TaxID=117069 RepID=A0A9P7KKD3_9AGAR|nr:hypothetical protein H0H81_008020 [Sphagnurus paluster]